jgi:hypothetical protein
MPQELHCGVKPPWVSGNRDSYLLKVCRSIRLSECDGAHVYGLMTTKIGSSFRVKSGHKTHPARFRFSRLRAGEANWNGQSPFHSIFGDEFGPIWHFLTAFAQQGEWDSCCSVVCIVAWFRLLGAFTSEGLDRRTESGWIERRVQITLGREPLVCCCRRCNL